MGNVKVIELAALLGRKVGSASLKLANFARLDPALQARNIKGLSHGSKGEIEVWVEFSEDPEMLVFESTKLLADKLGSSIEEVAEIKESDLPPAGLEREALVKLRVNQTYFRNRVLSAYEYRCCVTGLTNRILLTASHIVPWAKDPKNRLNPRNGLCLNPLHDRAFDRHLMWVDANFRVKFSPQLNRAPASSTRSLDWLLSFEGRQLQLPEQFKPDAELLSKHASIAIQKAGKF
jgi:putative restriction endonuclease